MNGVIGMAELLLNDILDFSKIEAGKLELEHIEFDLADCVGRTVQTLTVRAAEKGLELACHIPPDIPANVVGDSGRLRQIIVNLFLVECPKMMDEIRQAVTTQDAGKDTRTIRPHAERIGSHFLRYTCCAGGITARANRTQRSLGGRGRRVGGFGKRVPACDTEVNLTL